MGNFFKMLFMAILVFVVLAIVMVGLFLGLHFMFNVLGINCELVAYIETGILFGIIILLTYLISTKRVDMELKK